jgi:hypothetical protein
VTGRDYDTDVDGLLEADLTKTVSRERIFRAVLAEGVRDFLVHSRSDCQSGEPESLLPYSQPAL